jgi:hypothetical protein
LQEPIWIQPTYHFHQRKQNLSLGISEEITAMGWTQFGTLITLTTKSTRLERFADGFEALKYTELQTPARLHPPMTLKHSDLDHLHLSFAQDFLSDIFAVTLLHELPRDRPGLREASVLAS